MRNRAVEHNVATFLRAFPCCTLAAKTKQGLVLQLLKLLTTAVMVDNLVEKVNECPLNQGRQVLFAYNWDSKSCPLYRVAECPLLRGCLSIEVNGKMVGTFRIVCCIVSPLLSGVH